MLLFQILQTVKQKKCEVTIEANPETLNEELINLWNNLQVNRISMGVQTTNLKILKLLNRAHTLDDVEKNIKFIQKFSNIKLNLDFIYNLPLQNEDIVLNDLKYIARWKPDHLSFYSLILKDNTPLAVKLKELDLEKEGLFFDLIVKQLVKDGYLQYEISNFVKNLNNKCLHNSAIWHLEPYLGIGPGAISMLKINQKFYFKTNTRTFHTNWTKKFTKLSKYDYFFNKIMMGLRLKEGINLNLRENQHLVYYFWIKINKLLKNKTLLIENNYLKVSSKKWNFLNDILIKF